MKQFAWPVKLTAWALASVLTCGVFAQEGNRPAAAKEKEATTADADLPTAQEVLKRFIDKIGGEAAYKKHQSQHATGMVSLGQQMQGEMEVFAARPNKLLMIIEMPGVGKITTGFNGEVGWMSNPLTGPMILPKEMLEQVATQADFDHALRLPKDFTTMEMLGVEEFNGEPCYKLKLVHRTGFESTEFYSRETGLQIGFISSQASPLGEVNVTTLVTDYEKFDDILMPSRIVQKVSGMEQVVTIDKMEFDTVPESKFELPAEVKTLAEAMNDSAADREDTAEEVKDDEN